jgi:hypothetical protein
MNGIGQLARIASGQRARWIAVREAHPHPASVVVHSVPKHRSTTSVSYMMPGADVLNHAAGIDPI